MIEDPEARSSCENIFLFSERTMLYSHIAIQKFALLISACACSAVRCSVTIWVDPQNARLHPWKLWESSLDAWSTRVIVKLLLSGIVNWPQEWTNLCSWKMMVLKSILSRPCLYLKALYSKNEYSQEYWCSTRLAIFVSQTWLFWQCGLHF